MEPEKATCVQDGQSPCKSVLLVEDDVSIEPVWRLIFSLANHKVTLDWVTSESAAQRAIWEKQKMGATYDLIVTDIFLSGCKTGIDLWRENHFVGTAFIFTSAVSAAKFSKFFAGEQRCPPFVAKPIDPTACISTINTILTSQKGA